jgi:SAM-dependent methyltransferase
MIFIKLAKFILSRTLVWLTAPFLPKTLARLVQFFISTIAANRPPKDALVFLLELEQKIFCLTGYVSCCYGEGLHTKHRHTRYHDFFTQRLRPGERIFDIGCGSGALAYDMAQTGALVVGIDIDAENISFGRQRFSHPNLELIHGDALSDLPEREFDTIVMSNVLEHIEYRISFLQKIQKKYGPKHWLLRVPVYDRDWRVPLMEEVGVDYRLDDTHFIEYTKDQFKEELQQAGLYITHIDICWGEIWAEVR